VYCAVDPMRTGSTAKYLTNVAVRNQCITAKGVVIGQRRCLELGTGTTALHTSLTSIGHDIKPYTGGVNEVYDM
jgi:hypothetical protein